jgi:hemerythrin-like domain-containing protein
MKTATGILRREHEAIRTMLGVAEALARRLAAGESTEPRDLLDVQEFFQHFADGTHHEKEEKLLFPVLAKRGVPRHGGPLSAMHSEHETGRSLLDLMGHAAEEFGKGVREAGTQWAETTLGYCELLRHHIHKEDVVLFAVTERVLSGADQERLAEEFDRYELERLGPERRERLQATVARMGAALLGK